ncbi:hypothetical protein DLn1_00006 [Bacillus phage DLn1]|nr:hypothetical protein DLn1_00006 [Bacillus phage DLn1]
MVCKFYFETKEVTGMFIKEEDYLKVVEENKYLKQQDKERETTINNYEKSLREKDEEIKRLKETSKNIDDRRIECELYIEKINKGFIQQELIRLGNFCVDNNIGKSRGNTVDCVISHIVNIQKEIKELKNKITCLEFGIEEKEELWSLEYVYEKEGIRKNVILDPQPLEGIHELVGMDCDNWVSWTIEKEVK